jgi:hypothetical protein
VKVGLLLLLAVPPGAALFLRAILKHETAAKIGAAMQRVGMLLAAGLVAVGVLGGLNATFGVGPWGHWFAGVLVLGMFLVIALVAFGSFRMSAHILLKERDDRDAA